MQLTQLIYASRPFCFDDLTLWNILYTARQNNRRDGITGALISRDDIFLQMLEGGRDVVTAAYARILRDSRHVEVTGLWSDDVGERLFPAWEMRDDPAQSWMWTPAAVSAGAVLKAPAREVRDIFVRLASAPPEGRSFGTLG